MDFVDNQNSMNSGYVRIHSPYTFKANDFIRISKDTSKSDCVSYPSFGKAPNQLLKTEPLSLPAVDTPIALPPSCSSTSTVLQDEVESFAQSTPTYLTPEPSIFEREYHHMLPEAVTQTSPKFTKDKQPSQRQFSDSHCSQQCCRGRGYQTNPTTTFNTTPINSSANTHPTLTHVCHLCSVACSNEEQMIRHLNGKLHKKKLQDREFRTLVFSNVPTQCQMKHIHELLHGFQLDFISTGNCPVAFVPNYNSGFVDCWVVMESLEECQGAISALTNQCQLLGHAVSLERARTELTCDVCQVKLNSEMQMAQHLRGKLHAQKLKNSPSQCLLEVHGLPPAVTVADLLQHFRGYGLTKERVQLEFTHTAPAALTRHALAAQPPPFAAQQRLLPNYSVSTDSTQMLGPSALPLRRQQPPAGSGIGAAGVGSPVGPVVSCVLSVKSPQVALQLIQEKHGSVLKGAKITLQLNHESFIGDFLKQHLA